MESIIDFFNNPVFVIIGGLLLGWSLLTFGLGVYSVTRGMARVWWRLGKGITKKRIAVFAEGEHYVALNQMLVDSGLFQSSNIIRITKDSLKKGERCDVFLMHWKDFESKLDEILSMKTDTTSLIIYALPGEIPPSVMLRIGEHRNVTVVNMRGRLLNDILLSMITTGYQAK